MSIFTTDTPQKKSPPHYVSRNKFADIWPLIRRLIHDEKRDMAVVFVYGVVASILGLVVPLSSQAIVNVVALGIHTEQLIVLCVIVLLALLTMAVIMIFQRHVIDYIQRRQFLSTAREFVSRLPRVQETVYESLYAPELVNRFFDIVTVQKAFSKFLLDGVAALLSMVTGLVVLAIYHPFFFLYDIVFLLFIPVLVFLLGRRGIATAVEESSMKYKTLEWIEEVARSHRSIKLHKGYDYAVGKVSDLAFQYANAKEKHFSIYARQIIGSYIFKAFATVGILALGGTLVIDQQISLGQLVAAEIIIVLMMGSMDKFLSLFDIYYDFAAAVAKIQAVNDLPVEFNGKSSIVTNASDLAVETLSVTTPYSTQHNHDANVSVKIRKNSRVALIGSNHFELTYLAKIMAGLRNPIKGFVEVYGHNVVAIDNESLHTCVTYVDSEDVVHQATIYENITMGNDVSSTDLQAAIKAACLDQDLRMLPLGVHTETDTLGRNLTASIRKRIVLARALLNKPSLVVINGLIDSVDYRLQVSIMNALNSLEDTTIIHVTGDPVVIQACERAIVIDNGSVVNDGNANDLLSSDEFLKTLLAN